MPSPELHPYSAPAGHSGAFLSARIKSAAIAAAARGGAVSAFSPAAAPVAASAETSALGNGRETVDRAYRQKLSLSRHASRSTALALLNIAGRRSANSLAICGRAPTLGTVSLRRNVVTGRVAFAGLRYCGSVWLCPCCSPRIANGRREELNKLLAGARAEKLSPFMVTLTARHDRSMALAPFLDKLKLAKRRFRQRREWRALPFQGSVTATEVTHGANGWHPHFHEIVLLSGDTLEGLRQLKALAAVWRRCLESYGLSGGKAAFQVQGADAAGTYIGKFGAGEEMALAGSKDGRHGSRTPWQLLDDARDGDKRAAGLWLEYAAGFHGKAQLVWSPGLKARFAIGEMTDEEAAAMEAETNPAAWETLRAYAGERWKHAATRQLALIRAAERGACLDHAENGPSDAKRWRRIAGDVWQEWP